MTLISLQLLFPCLYRLNLTRYRPPALGFCAGIISRLTSDVTRADLMGTALQTGTSTPRIIVIITIYR